MYLLLPTQSISGGLVFGKLLYSLLHSRAFRFVTRGWNREKILSYCSDKNPPGFGQFQRY